MSIYDNINKKGQNSLTSAFSFDRLPESLEEMKAMPEAALDTPFKAAALTICALCAYACDREIGKQMLNFLRGPRPLSPMDISFLNDRFMDGKTYVPFSYFKGAIPENDYTPDRPFEVSFSKDAYSDANEGYCRLNVRSGGAGSPRQITLRRLGDGTWRLWEQAVLVGIRDPKSQNPWG